MLNGPPARLPPHFVDQELEAFADQYPEHRGLVDMILSVRRVSEHYRRKMNDMVRNDPNLDVAVVVHYAESLMR